MTFVFSSESAGKPRGGELYYCLCCPYYLGKKDNSHFKTTGHSKNIKVLAKVVRLYSKKQLKEDSQINSYLPLFIKSGVNNRPGAKEAFSKQLQYYIARFETIAGCITYQSNLQNSLALHKNIMGEYLDPCMTEEDFERFKTEYARAGKRVSIYNPNKFKNDSSDDNDENSEENNNDDDSKKEYNEKDDNEKDDNEKDENEKDDNKKDDNKKEDNEKETRVLFLTHKS